MKPLKKVGDNEESYNVRYASRQYDSKISELEKKSTGKDKKILSAITAIILKIQGFLQ